VTRRIAFLIAVGPLLLAAASAPIGFDAEPIDVELKRARQEAQAAEADMRRLDQAAAKARGDAARLAAERRAAAAAIAASEASISAADAQVRLAEAQVAMRSARLAERQSPLAALLAGVVSMGRRPPLLSVADSSSVGEIVRVRALLDTTLPVIRARTASLSGELAESRRAQASARHAREQLNGARRELERRQQRFAALEDKATERAAKLGAGAVEAADVMVASSETEARVLSAAEHRSNALRLAAELGALPPAPTRPGPAHGQPPPLQYRLPITAKLSEGVGAVSETGIRSRGLSFEAVRGDLVSVPADGTIAFAGPFRRYDGVVIIDHGNGWMTLMTGVRAERRKGERVGIGEPLGRALGSLTVELSTNGTPVSAALIAGSSQMVSNKAQTG
jgi:septal ring factor EnvC (AmiA/AmiB activator)